LTGIEANGLRRLEPRRKREKLLRSLSLQQSIKTGVPLSQNEMKNIVAELFACTTPNATPTGKPTYMSFKKDEMDKIFGR
jgi:DNA mismatch repair protein MutL